MTVSASPMDLNRKCSGCAFLKGILKIRPSKTDTFIIHYSFFIIHLTVEFIDSLNGHYQFR